jgi:hypothetical protein
MRTIARISVVALIGCAGTSHSVVFQSTDQTFVAQAGQTPAVYVEADDVKGPKSTLRSVGLIKVTARESSGLEHVIELAAEKGRELGCWMVIEHKAFESMQAQVELEGGGSIILAHGAAPHAGPAPRPNNRTTVFDCIVRGTPPPNAHSVAVDA